MRFATTALIAASAAAAPELIFRDPSSSSDVKLEYADGVLTIPQHCRLQHLYQRVDQVRRVQVWLRTSTWDGQALALMG